MWLLFAATPTMEESASTGVGGGLADVGRIYLPIYPVPIRFSSPSTSAGCVADVIWTSFGFISGDGWGMGWMANLSPHESHNFYIHCIQTTLFGHNHRHPNKYIKIVRKFLYTLFGHDHRHPNKYIKIVRKFLYILFGHDHRHPNLLTKVFSTVNNELFVTRRWYFQ